MVDPTELRRYSYKGWSITSWSKDERANFKKPDTIFVYIIPSYIDTLQFSSRVE